ncbi:TPA: hypothetical protein EYP66_08020 [Candidatus Poribacteria bacterium]|nr:hypothetical protein [Candidatus Poribacteria bacterium]
MELKTNQGEKDSGFILEWVELTDEMLEKKIQDLEAKYHLDSKTFFKLYQEGKPPEPLHVALDVPHFNAPLMTLEQVLRLKAERNLL